MQDFEKLVVWRRAQALSLGVDRLVRERMRDGSATLRSQLSRAADSVGANIAEGCGASSQREFARFLDIAIKSTSETQHHLLSALDRELLPGPECAKLTDEASQIRRMLYALRKRVLEDLAPAQPRPTDIEA
jgi:four helix bundle protein